MTNSKTFDERQSENVDRRRAAIKRWAEYVRTHDDAEWSRQQNKLIDSQLQSANELAANGDTDPVEFAKARDRLRDREE